MRSKTGEIRERVREQTMNLLEELESPMFNLRSPRGSIANVSASCDLLDSSLKAPSLGRRGSSPLLLLTQCGRLVVGCM